MKTDFVLLGIDGGATKVSGWQVLLNQEGSFSLGSLNAQKSYREIPGFIADFKPIEVPVQLKAREKGTIDPTADEKQQETVYVEACAQVIESIVEKSGSNRIVVGIGMPGLKTDDKRGISVVANGPRMINYSDLLEKRLQVKQIELVSPIQHLGSDADYCGIGENYSKAGLFKDVTNAYYLGGGTGVADAMKLDNKLVPFDEAKPWMAKSWEMKSEDGRSLERFASAGGIQSIYADTTGNDIARLNADNIYPLQIATKADDGDANAIAAFELVVKNLTLLLYERITTLFAGWQQLFTFVNPNRPLPHPDHEFKGYLFDRIIIGQRLGELFDSPAGSRVLKEPVLEKLHEMIQSAQVLEGKAKMQYNDLNKIIITSQLREAPALGAGIDAYFGMQARQG